MPLFFVSCLISFQLVLSANSALVLTNVIRQQILQDHNWARRNLAIPVATNMLELQYDMLLEQTAQNYLVKSNCVPSTFTHNAARTSDYLALGGQHGSYVGENWYSGDPVNSSANIWDALFGGATQAWTRATCSGASSSCNSAGCVTKCTSSRCSEMGLYYGTCKDHGDQGHFTQVMWATTQYVGCGYTQKCGTLCDYAQGGNIVGQSPWKTGGKAASNCPSVAPYNNNDLCSSNPSSSSTVTSNAKVTLISKSTTTPKVLLPNKSSL